jgi:hypothetical protein
MGRTEVSWDGVHLIDKVKGCLFPRFQCKQTNPSTSQSNANQHIDTMDGPFSHNNDALSSASASLDTSHLMKLAFGEHGGQAKVLGRAILLPHKACCCVGLLSLTEKSHPQFKLVHTQPVDNFECSGWHREIHTLASVEKWSFVFGTSISFHCGNDGYLCSYRGKMEPFSVSII